MLRRRIALLHCTIAGFGCQIGDLTVYREAPPATETPAVENRTGRVAIEDGDDVLTFLDGARLVMDAVAIPTHPNGFDRNVNFGQATQCIHEVTMDVLAGGFRVTTNMAQLQGAPMPEDVGVCDPSTASGEQFSFDTTAALVENVRDDGRCFDITLTYAGFGQEGRGEVSADGGTLLLELFFRDQASGHRCADGDVGEATITLNQESFTGDAVQVYRIEAP